MTVECVIVSVVSLAMCDYEFVGRSFTRSTEGRCVIEFNYQQLFSRNDSSFILLQHCIHKLLPLYSIAFKLHPLSHFVTQTWTSVRSEECVWTAGVRTYPGHTSVCVTKASNLRLTTRSAGVSSYRLVNTLVYIYISCKHCSLTVCVCSDINECQDTRLCANGHCINTEGSFQCQCYSGYQPTQEGSHCEGEHC